VAEEVIIARDIALARITGGRYHVLHLSSAEGVALVRNANAAGIHVTAEGTPQHLTLTDERLRGGDALFKMNPPLRSADHMSALRSGLVDHTIDAIATDHAPHLTEDKARPIVVAPPGMTGLETAMAAINSELVVPGILSLSDLVAAFTWRPAAIAGLATHGHGGPIRVGAGANLTVFDPTATWMVDPSRLGSKGHNNPYRGRVLQGRVRHSVLRGVPTAIDAGATR